MKEKNLKILLVGQTPPPFLGQALMIQKTLEGDYGKNINLIHVRMGFSKGAADIGRVKGYKFKELARVIFQIFLKRILQRPQVLYYFPSGPNRVPILRDIVILGLTRWMFKKTIFHFQAGGLSEYFQTAHGLERSLMTAAYSRPDISIRLSEFTPEDGLCFGALQEFILPNASEDLRSLYPPPPRPDDAPAGLIFLGALKENKGILVLVEACRLLRERQLKFVLQLVGEFECVEFGQKVREAIKTGGLESQVLLPGVLTGEKKAQAFHSADILCMPTYFDSEAFPVVIVEGMCFGLPVVATRWRGIPTLVQEGKNGFLVPIRDPVALAERIENLIRDPDLRQRMGAAGRENYLEKYTLEAYHKRLREIFTSLVHP